jgi:hypothetical protein
VGLSPFLKFNKRHLPLIKMGPLIKCQFFLKFLKVFLDLLFRTIRPVM